MIFSFAQANAGISFQQIGIDQALGIGKQKDKLIFIDSYASWCAPCKVMDQVFEQRDVGTFFNSNFVNVKVDMDGPYGDLLLRKYEVVWLPTLLILNGRGDVLVKIDRLLDANELLTIANEALSGVKSNPASSLTSNPFSNSSNYDPKEDYDPNTKEEVIYVYDQRTSSGRPHIMYHEAYLHLQLMDGQHSKVVKKYLSTQEDWSSEKNIRFIFDFLNSTNSSEFRYFTANRKRFEEVIGKKKVEKTLSILVHLRLEQGYPRPSLNEAISLFEFINKSTARIEGYRFYLSNLNLENQDLEFINIATSYLKNINPYDDAIIHQLVHLRSNRSDARKYVTEDIELMITAISLRDNNHKYYSTLSQLYFSIGESQLAFANVEKAIQLAAKSGANTDDYLNFKKKLSIN